MGWGLQYSGIRQDLTANMALHKEKAEIICMGGDKTNSGQGEINYNPQGRDF